MKRFMMAAALFGAMTLGACVDNQESQSVTDIRDAKTEELKSQAALNNAQAEAAKVMANAEAALMAAEAEYQKALAEQVAAETELLEVEKQLAEVEVAIREAELEAALTELEAAKAELEATKADVQARIAASLAAKAAAEAQLEVDLAKAQAALLKQQLAVFNASKNLEAAQKIDYIALYNEYAKAISNLNSARRVLLQAQNNYEGYKLGTTNEQEARINQIAALQENIANYNNEIAKYEAQIAAFSEFVTLPSSELMEKAEELTAKKQAASIKAELAWTAYNTWNEKQSVSDPFETDFVNYVYSWASAMYPEYKQPYANAEYVGWIAPVISWDENAIGYYVEGADPAYPEFVAMIENIDEPFKWGYEQGSYADLLKIEDESGMYSYWYEKYDLRYKFNEEGWSKYLAAWGKALENCPEKKDAEDAQKALEELVKAANAEDGAFALYEAAVKAYNEAKAKAEMEDATAEDAAKLAEAEAALNDARDYKEMTEAQIAMAENMAENAANWYAYNVSDYEAICEEFEYLKEAYAECVAATDAYNAYAKDSQVGELALAVMASNFEMDAIDAEIIALNEAYAADDNYENQIELWQEAIDGANTLIAEAEAAIAELEKANLSDDEFLARLEKTIADYELMVAAYEKQAAEAKAKLDAALAE